MIKKDSLADISDLFLNFRENLNIFYKNSSFYEKKISKVDDSIFDYKPSPYLLSSIIKYQKKKYKIEDFALNSIWNDNLNLQDFEKLNNFIWFFSLDLKSSKKRYAVCNSKLD